MDRLIGNLSVYFYPNEGKEQFRDILRNQFINDTDIKVEYSAISDETNKIKFIDYEDHLRGSLSMQLGEIEKGLVII